MMQQTTPWLGGLGFFWCSTLSFIKTKLRKACCQQIWCKWTAEWGWVVWLDSWWSVIRCSFESWRACSGGSTIHCSQRILGRRWQTELGGASKGVQPLQQVCCWISWCEVMNSTVFLFSVYFIYKITYTHVFLFDLRVKIVAYFWFSYFENNRNIESSISFTDVSWWLELPIGFAFKLTEAILRTIELYFWSSNYLNGSWSNNLHPLVQICHLRHFCSFKRVLQSLPFFCVVWFCDRFEADESGWNPTFLGASWTWIWK